MPTKPPAITAPQRVERALATIAGLRLAAVLPKTRRRDRAIHAAVDRALDAVEAQLRDPHPGPVPGFATGGPIHTPRTAANVVPIRPHAA